MIVNFTEMIFEFNILYLVLSFLVEGFVLDFSVCNFQKDFWAFILYLQYAS